MKWRSAMYLAAGTLQLACTTLAMPEAEPHESNELGMDVVLQYTFDVVGMEGEYASSRLSNRSDDVDCAVAEQGDLILRPHSTSQTDLSRRASPERALYEWHLCFEIDGRTYRGWRGFDPGPGSRIELECRIDASEPPSDRYACTRTKLEVASEIYGDAAYACRSGEACRRFESEQEYRFWKALPILTRDEKIAVTVALIHHELAGKESYLAVNEMDYYVRAGDEDLPSEIGRSLSRPGHRFYPASDRRKGRGASMTVSNFLRKSDGTMEVDYWFSCGFLCESGHTAILKRNESGEWEVLSTEMYWIS